MSRPQNVSVIALDAIDARFFLIIQSIPAAIRVTDARGRISSIMMPRRPSLGRRPMFAELSASNKRRRVRCLGT
jgi:hypothetical protein